MNRDEDGYRYLREYKVRGVSRYALWERVNGKMRRVDTAHVYEVALRWIRHEPAP